MSMNRKGMGQVTLETHPDGQKGGRMAELALTQIRLSTLQGFQERVVHLTLGQTRRLLGGTVAPAGACSSHKNPRREREGDVRCPLHLKRLGPYGSPEPAVHVLGIGQRWSKGCQLLRKKGTMAS